MNSVTKLADITIGQQNFKILARLTRIWDSKNMSSRASDPFISIDGVVLDEHGAMAHITVPKRLEKQYRPQLTQGSVYIFGNLSAVDTKQKTYIYHHQKYMLQFQPNSTVHCLDSRGGSIPQFAFNFCPFDQLPSKNIRSKPLIDLIGVISHIGPYDFASPTSSKKLRKLQIRDLEEQSQELMLWCEHGESFDESSVIEKSKQGIVIAIFAGLTISNFSAQTESSSSSATKVFIDLNVPEVAKFRDSYKWELPTLQQQLPQIQKKTPIEAAGQIYKIDELSALPNSSFQCGATCSCIAKITAIVPSIKWYYKACRNCKIGYNNISDTPRCDCANSQPMPMFKLPITITDDTGSINAIAFSYIAEDLVERNAYQASQNMKIDAADQTVSLQTAVGKIRLFQIAMSNDSSSNFSIKYVLRKSFPIDDPPSTLLLLNKEDTPAAHILSLPTPDNTCHSRSSAKRCLQFEDEQNSHKQSKPQDSTSNEHSNDSIRCSEQHTSASDDQHKRQKKMAADQDTDNVSTDTNTELPATPTTTDPKAELPTPPKA